MTDPDFVRKLYDRYSELVSKGDVVLVKPNVAFDRSPSLGATTHPETVAAVVRQCRQAGAKEIIVCDNPINSPDKNARAGLEFSKFVFIQLPAIPNNNVSCPMAKYG